MSTLMKSRPNVSGDLPSFFDDFLTRDLFDWALGNSSEDGGTLPAVNIRDTHDTYELEVAAPGMKKNDFNVELNDDTLLITGDMKMEDQEKYQDYTRREFRYENFQRSFRLPENMVKSDEIKAKYENGILHITVPKAEAAKSKPPKKIKVN